MKQIILLFFVFILPLSAYCQVNNLEEGNQCFNQGDYICAVAKYKEVFKTATGKDKQIADIKIQRAKRCIENLKNADLAFNGKKYTKAKEFYLAILDSNPQDEFVKGRLESINKFLSTPVQKPLNPTTKSPSNPIKLSLSKTEISFKSSGGSDYIDINLNSNLYTIEMLPSWCSVQKYNNYFVVICNVNKEISKRSDYFYVKNGVETIRVNVTQQASSQGNENLKVDDNKNTLSNNKEQVGNSKPPKKYKQKLYSFSSIGFQSGEIAKYGFIYEHGGKKTVGFRFSLRTSLTSEQDILNGAAAKNKTEIELGPNFRILNRLYFNIGFGYGYYKRLLNNDFAGNVYLEKTGYSVATTGLMFRISKAININAGAAFMDIHKDLYKPEFTFGVTYNLKKNTGQGFNTKPSRNYKTKLSSFSSLGFQSGEIAKYGLLYETGGRKTVGFRISARTTLEPEQIFGGGDIENKKEIELGPNFRMSNRIYLNLGVGYGKYEFPPYQDKIGYYIATTGIMYRISRVINLNGGLSFNYINNDMYFDNALKKTEITFGISFNLRGKYKY